MFKHKSDGGSREVPLVPLGQTTHHHNDCFFLFFPSDVDFQTKGGYCAKCYRIVLCFVPKNK